MLFRKGVKEGLYESASSHKENIINTNSVQRNRSFFRDYTEYRIPGKKGKGYSYRRLYTGDYYELDLPGRTWIAVKAVYLLLWSAATVLFVSGTIDVYSVEVTTVLFIVQAVTGWLLLWLLFSILEYVFSPRRKNIREYEYGNKVRHKGLYCCIGIMVCTVFTVAVSVGKTETAELIFGILKMATAAGFSLGIYYLENKMKYLTVPNSYVLPDNAELIE